MFHKIKSVASLPNYHLLVHFTDGTAKQYDVNPLFGPDSPFNDLKEVPGLFAQVTADPGGYGISWNDDIDMACDELWANGVAVDTPFADLLSFADATSIWGLNESTLRKAVSYQRLIEGIDVQKFGKQWIVTRSAMEREYGLPSQAAQ